MTPERIQAFMFVGAAVYFVFMAIKVIRKEK